MTNTALKAQIDSQITNETLPNSVSPTDVGGNLKAVVDFIGYNSYSALISQSGTSAPTVKVLNNTTGVTFTLSRNSSGNYTLTGSSDVFTSDKTGTLYNFNSNGSFPNGSMFFYSIGAQFFIIETRDSGTPTDGVITDSFIEIRVYN